MNIESILNYQKMDENLYKVEQKLVNSAYRKKANELAQVAKKAQSTSIELEAEADKLIAEIDEIKKNYKTNRTKADELLNMKLENLTVEELDKIAATKTKVVSNLSVLEKMLQKSAENINRILSE